MKALPRPHIGIKTWLIWLILPFLLLGCASGITVIDGDTINLPSGEAVRYLGIDTSERGEPYYEEAKRANRELGEGKQIELETDVTDRDKYNRLLRYVYVDGTLVNAELARQGYALVYREDKFPDSKHYNVLKKAADEAAEGRRGIWSLSPPHPKIQRRPGDYYLPPAFSVR